MPKSIERVWIVLRLSGAKGSRWQMYKVFASQTQAERYCRNCQFHTAIREMEITY